MKKLITLFLLIPFWMLLFSCSGNKYNEDLKSMCGKWQSCHRNISLDVFESNGNYYLQICCRYSSKVEIDTYPIIKKKGGLNIDSKLIFKVFYDRERDRIISLPYDDFYRKN